MNEERQKRAKTNPGGGNRTEKRKRELIEIDDDEPPAKKSHIDPKKPQSSQLQNSVQILLEMGYNAEDANIALNVTNGSVEEAINLLSQGAFQ